MAPGVTMSRRLLPIHQLLGALANAPSQIAELTIGLSAVQLRKPPGRDEWSANEVLAHLRSCADVWGGCIARIADEHKPTIRAINPRTWIEGTDYPDIDFQPSLRAFSRQRLALMKLLGDLSSAGWSRSATVTGAGAPLKMTIQSYADRMVRHERPHIKQIGRIAAGFKGER